MRQKVLNKLKFGFKTFILMTLVCGLCACAKRGSNQGSAMDEAAAGGVGDTMKFYGSGVSPAQEKELLNKRTYYFAYDGFEVSDEDTLSLYAHAKRLITSPNMRIRVEGHTDERGSREYNIALGERRANAVANILMLKGVNQDQISIVSYGKEKPAALGHDDSSWSQNRRAVIVYEVE